MSLKTVYIIDNDFKKLETIEKVVLMSSANREKRKERVRKYRQWVSVGNVCALREENTVEWEFQKSGKWVKLKKCVYFLLDTLLQRGVIQ